MSLLNWLYKQQSLEQKQLKALEKYTFHIYEKYRNS